MRQRGSCESTPTSLLLLFRCALLSCCADGTCPSVWDATTGQVRETGCCSEAFGFEALELFVPVQPPQPSRQQAELQTRPMLTLIHGAVSAMHQLVGTFIRHGVWLRVSLPLCCAGHRTRGGRRQCELHSDS